MRNKKTIMVLALCVVLIILSAAASLSYGSRVVTLAEVSASLFQGSSDSFNAIVMRERIPRTVFALMAGASLGVSGSLMQAITRNPIADPSILGVNTGASLFVVMGMAFLKIGSLHEYIFLALFGAGVTAVFVYTIGSMGYGGPTPIKLALAGAATSAALSSLVSAVILPRTDVMNAYRFWQVGSVGGATWAGIYAVLPFLIIGLLLSLLVTPSLDALALGDDLATGLGVRTGLIRISAAVAGVILCGATTAIAGPIGFVGLMVPHTMKLLLGPHLRLTIPFSAMGGGILLTFADVIGRLLGSPSELESGIVTAFIGAPILIYIAMKSKGRAL